MHNMLQTSTAQSNTVPVGQSTLTVSAVIIPWMEPSS